jgi:hypothetical protein|nr:DUF4266 domain-containing protein [Kofleriaceae bacterium]
MTRVLALALAMIAASATVAAAFPTGEQFDGDALATDGGGGIPFTGAPRFAGHTCVVCHTDAPGQISLKLEADHPDLFTTGWVAGTQYQLRVILLGEHEGLQFAGNGDNCGGAVDPYVPCDDNGFALEIDDGSGSPVGRFAAIGSAGCAAGSAEPIGADAYVLKDGTAVTHSGAHAAQVAWNLCWTAPAAGAGTIEAYAAVVDGNGGNGSAFPNDTTGDDVFAGVLAIPEAGGAPPPAESGGCDAAGHRALPSGQGVLVGLVLALALRRRGASALLIAVAFAIATTTGCTHVRATQRETLARKNMQFGPDATEDELDLHMQEAREGSSGGYGSSGGGCGCN